MSGMLFGAGTNLSLKQPGGYLLDASIASRVTSRTSIQSLQHWTADDTEHQRTLLFCKSWTS